MTNTVQQPPTEGRGRIGLRNVGSDDSDLLVLEGNDPKTVLVRAAFLNGETIAEFSCPESNSGWFTGGLSWNSDHEHAMFVTFSFAPSDIDVSVVGIDTDLPSSPPYGTNLSSQDMCIPPVFHADVVYSFLVKFHNGMRHDPKILVTPINA